MSTELAHRPHPLRAALSSLLGFKESPLGIADALRLTSCITLPMLVLTALGMLPAAMLSALGSYIVLFGAGQLGRRRAALFAVMGVVECAAISIGMWASESIPLLVAAMIILALGGVLMDRAMSWGSPGPYFVVLLVGIGSTVGQSGLTPTAVIPWLALGALLAALAGMSDLLTSPHRPEQRALERAARDVEGLEELREDARPHGEVPRHVWDAASAMGRAWGTGLAGAAGARRPGSFGRWLRAELIQLQKRWITAADRLVLGRPPRTLHTVQTVGGLERTAIGAPALRDRLVSLLAWPTPTTLNLARMVAALLLGGVAETLLSDAKPFWLFSVIVLVLSYPGDQRALTWRAVQRALGTFAGLGVFLAVDMDGLGPWGMALAFCVLLILVSLITGRNYFWGSIAITVMALLLVSNLSDTDPSALARNRWVDTLVAVGIALVVLWLIGPGLVPAVLRRSIRQLRREQHRLHDFLRRGTDPEAPEFVRSRRRMQAQLTHLSDVRAFTVHDLSRADPPTGPASPDAQHPPVTRLAALQRTVAQRSFATLLRCTVANSP